MLDDNLANYFIRPSQSPSGAPIPFIKTKHSSLRLSVGPFRINQITRKVPYFLPLIPDLLDCLRAAHLFSKNDLRGAYNPIRTRYSTYEFQVVLMNAPAS